MSSNPGLVDHLSTQAILIHGLNVDGPAKGARLTLFVIEGSFTYYVINIWPIFNPPPQSVLPSNTALKLC